MNLLRRLLMSIGATALIVLVFTLFVPKTAHALVAALVQVANTTASPAIALDVSHAASQNAAAWCFTEEPSCFLVLANSPLVQLGAVPAGENFIVTAVDITATSPLSVSLTGAATLPGFLILDYQWNVPGDGNTHTFEYPSGIAFGAGYQFNNSNVHLGAGLVQFILHGYITPN